MASPKDCVLICPITKRPHVFGLDGRMVILSSVEKLSTVESRSRDFWTVISEETQDTIDDVSVQEPPATVSTNIVYRFIFRQGERENPPEKYRLFSTPGEWKILSDQRETAKPWKKRSKEWIRIYSRVFNRRIRGSSSVELIE
jgi:hypothetical protein